jgi:hypothetical protein
VRAWLEDGRVGTCPRRKPIFESVPAFAPAASPQQAGPRRTLALASATLREAVATWLMTAGVDGEETTVAASPAARPRPRSPASR